MKKEKLLCYVMEMKELIDPLVVKLFLCYFQRNII